MNRRDGSFVLGMLLCWLLNVVHIGIALLILFTSERSLASVYVLLAGLGLLQIAYVVPLYRLLRRRGKPRSAKGLIIAALITAALITAVLNAVFVWHASGASIVRIHVFKS